MTHEIAIIGLGRFGSAVALELSHAGKTVVGVDKDRDVVQELADQLTDVIRADATDEDALRLMGITDFDAVVVALDEFEANLLTAASLKQFGVKQIIALALSDRHAAILNKIGVDQVILPEQEAAERLAKRLLDTATTQLVVQAGLSVGERLVPAEWVGKSLSELGVRSKWGVLAVSIRRGSLSLPVPGGDERFEAGDQIVFTGTVERLEELGCRVLRERA